MSIRKKKKSAIVTDFAKRMHDAPPPTWEEAQEIRKFMRSQARDAALDQIIRAMPKRSDSADPLADYLEAGTFLSTFLPSDGTESALSRLMVASTNAAMDCFARANTQDVPGRDLELNYAAKLALVTAALSKALDLHRSSAKEDFIDDTLPAPEDQKDSLTSLSERLRAKANSDSANSTKKKP